MMPATLDPDPAARQRQELACWFLRRRQARAWTDADEQAFAQWLAAPANQRAYAQWQADWALIDAMPAAQADRLRALAAADRAGGTARRRAIGRGLAVASVAAMACMGGWLGWRHIQAQPVYQQAFSTRKGQQVTARLPDGSTVRLDTASALQAVFHQDRRMVRLAQGQAFFAVAKDAQRPFTVHAGGATVTVRGTRFSVRYTPGMPDRNGVEVAVEEGRVHVAGAQGPQTFDLTAGQMLTLPPGAAPVRGAVPITGVAAWRAMPLSFSDVPLREAVDEMNRYADLGLAVRDPAVASLRLTGTFDPRNTAATRRLLAAALPIRLVDGPQGVEVRPLR